MDSKKKKKKRIEASPLALIMIEPLQDSEFMDVFPRGCQKKKLRISRQKFF